MLVHAALLRPPHKMITIRHLSCVYIYSHVHGKSIHMHVYTKLIFVSINANVRKMHAIRKQYMQPVCKLIYASRMHANCMQNESKVCAHACKQMLTSTVHSLACMHLDQILSCACKQKITCKIEFLLACSMSKFL